MIGRPSILVPFPHALDQDQAANAAVLAASRRGDRDPAAAVHARAAGGLAARRAADPASLQTAAAAAKAAGVPDAAERLAELVIEIAKL